MRSFTNLILVFFFVFTGNAIANENIKIQSIVGSKHIQLLNSKKHVKDGEVLQQGDRFIVPNSSLVTLKYPTGTKIVATSGAELIVGQAHEGKYKTHEDAHLDLKHGKIVVWIPEKKTKSNHRHRFRFKTNHMALGVRGTHFTVIADKNGTMVHVIKGHLEVSHHPKALHHEGGISIRAGEMTHTLKGKKPHPPKKFDRKTHHKHLREIHPGMKDHL